MAASFARAYELRDRMTEKNRLNIELIYYSNVTGELDKAYSVLLQALELFPRDVTFIEIWRTHCFSLASSIVRRT